MGKELNLESKSLDMLDMNPGVVTYKLFFVCLVLCVGQR